MKWMNATFDSIFKTFVIIAAGLALTAAAVSLGEPAEPQAQVEVFLIWTVVDGELHDVDAFRSAELCAKGLEEWQKMAEYARQTRKDLNIAFVGCVPVKTLAPAAPAPKTQGM